jgi:hypothetical protein
VSRRTPEERSEDADNALTWLRNKQNDSDDPTGEFKKIDQLLVGMVEKLALLLFRLGPLNFFCPSRTKIVALEVVAVPDSVAL